MDLPEDVVADILSRIPIKTIIRCKCVCKRWRNLLCEPYFVNKHLSRSPEGLIIHHLGHGRVPDILELAQLDSTSVDHYDIYRDPQMNLGLGGLGNTGLNLAGSVNGLVCLWNHTDGNVYICNPITREYIRLPECKGSRRLYDFGVHGFGFVEAINKYKIVRFYKDDVLSATDTIECEIYTLGTGTWRSLGQVPFLIDHISVSFGGKLHWLSKNDHEDEMICTLDLETELFHLTSLAPQLGIEGIAFDRSLAMFEGCLCICDNILDYGIIVWLMKETWSKEVVITGDYIVLSYARINTLKVSETGTILMLSNSDLLFTYHPGTKTLQKLDILRSDVGEKFDVMVYVPSLIRLSSLVLENVLLF